MSRLCYSSRLFLHCGFQVSGVEVMDKSHFLKGLLVTLLLSVVSFFNIAWSAEGRMGSCLAHDFGVFNEETDFFRVGPSQQSAGQQFCEDLPNPSSTCGNRPLYFVLGNGCGGTKGCYYENILGNDQRCHIFSMDWISNDIPDYNNVDPNKQTPCSKPESPTTTNPCVPANGNKFKPQTDIVASGNAIGFRRSYNSTSMGLGYFGAGWSSSAHKSLTVNGNSIVVRQASGRSEPFAKSNGLWSGDADSKLLILEAPNSYVLTLSNGNAEVYSLTGKLLSEVDTNGNEETYTYNSQNRLETISNNFGHQLDFVYNSIGHVTSITNASGAVYRYDYNTKNNLTSVTYPDQTPNTDADNPKRIYHYEDTRFPHHLTGITDENGVRHQTYAYKATGKVISSEKAVTTSTTGVGQERVQLVYSGNGTTRTITDAAGTDEIWTYTNNLDVQLLTSRINQDDGKGITQTYDANNNRLTHTDAEGRVTSYTYNATNQRTSMTEASGTPQAKTLTYEYVSADIDRVTRTTTPSVHSGSVKETVTVYDANLNITSTRINGFTESGQPVSRSSSFTYNTLGQVTQVDGPRTDVNDITTFAYYNCNTGSECGQMQSITNAKGHVTHYNSYDAMGRLLQSTDSNGVVTAYIYHPRGWLLSQTQTSAAGVRTSSYTYDNAGQMVGSTSPDGIAITYVYDEAHDLRSITDNLGNKVEYLYDTKGNRTETKTFDPNNTLIRQVTTDYDIRNFVKEINNAGSVTQILTDAVGNVATATDPNTNQSQSSFDALDRLQSTIDALTNTSSYQYNVADDLIQVQAPNGATTQFEFDDLSNQLKEISPDRGTTSYTHDAAGNVLAMTDARGITVGYQYDELSRVTQVTYPDTSENISYQYDNCQNGVGRLCQLTDNSGVTDYEYDPWGNITKTTKQEIDNTQQGAGAVLGTYITLYQYDAGNRISQMRYPSGRIVDYQRDALGRINGITTHFPNVAVKDILTSRTYRADGVWTEQILGNGLIHTKTYDQQGRLSSHTAGDYDRNYAYDANGNIVDITGTLNELYTYDPLDRLLKEMDSISNQFIEFSYDENGNRLTENDNAQISSLSYQANTNRLSAIAGTNLNIDPSGRTLVDQDGRQYSYNDVGRIEKIEQGSSILGEYVYGADQLRSRKTVNGIRTVFHYDLAGNMLSESNEQNQHDMEYVYADGERIAMLYGRPVLAGEDNTTPPSAPNPEIAKKLLPIIIFLLLDDDGNGGGGGGPVDPDPTPIGVTAHYYVNDHLGTPQRLVDDSQMITWEAEYQAFGEAVVTEGMVMNNHRFPGQYYDAETGLHYNWNRYYNAEVDRYATSDPIGLRGGLNTYGYVGGNPLNYYDPNGKVGQLAAGCLAGSWAGPLGCGAGSLIAGGLTVAGILTLSGSTHKTDEKECNKKCKPGEYGPFFHRPQSSGDTVSIVSSGQLWGKARQGSEIPQVQAKAGLLPSGSLGVEFCTTIKPHGGGNPLLPVWYYPNTPGTFTVPGHPGYAGIPIRILGSR